MEKLRLLQLLLILFVLRIIFDLLDSGYYNIVTFFLQKLGVYSIILVGSELDDQNY